MKGLVFTTFFDFCEKRFGADLLEDAIDRAALPHGGAYTSVGTYPFQEMVSLITAVVQLSGIPMPAVLDAFGQHCFGVWVAKFPAEFAGGDLFDVLARIDDFHESQVRKLYPDAELPSFKVASRGPMEMVLHYHSCKPLADLAQGVIKGAAAHLNDPVDVEYSNAGDHVRFQVRRAKARLAA